MAIKIGTIEVTGVGVGLTRVHSVYVGTEKIWEAVLIPTEVKYTSESGLPEWTGNVEGALIGSATAPNPKIPNVASSEEITLGNGVITVGNRAFIGCASLKSIYIPDNVLIMGINCFEGCTQLSGVVVPKDIKAIPNWAFYRCSSLQSVGLPDGLSSIGSGSFHTCTSLANITMPSGLVDIGNNAFNGCSGLAVIDMSNATQVPTIGQYTFYNTNNSFQVIVPQSLYDQWTQAPYWSSITGKIVPSTLRLTAEEANSTVAMAANGSAPTVSLEYSTDGRTWNPFVVGTTTVTLANIGDTVYIRATSEGNTRMGSSSSDYNTFVMTGKIAASGNVDTLLDQNGNATLTSYCYSNMFKNCTSLTTAPALPAKTLANNCYISMFQGCTSLTKAPVLPATVLADGCYWYMFRDCTSLTTAPALPATTLAIGCYRTMFQGCSNLNNITLGYTGNFADAPTNAFGNWVDGVASTGTFYYNGSDTTTGVSAIPTGWTVTPLTP